VGGPGSSIWLAGVIEKSCEELDQVECDMGGCRAFQNEVDFRASHSRHTRESYISCWLSSMVSMWVGMDW